MLDPQLVRSQLDYVAEQLKRRGFELNKDKLAALEEKRRVIQVETQQLQNERNTRSKSIGQAKA